VRWVILVLLIAGLFYAGKNLMPNPSHINVDWMASQVKRGMTQNEVKAVLGGEPTTLLKSGLGHDETWYYTDMYSENLQLAIQFIDGQVYQVSKTGK
jgi:outer membrane protein assembly factor BamE (lipoprotein component of BamABCDE complex)